MTVAMKIILQSGVTTTVEGDVQLYNKYEASLGLIYKRWGRGEKEERREMKRKKGIW